MDYQNLREQIVEVIRQNGNEEITGDVLQYILLQMVTALGEGYRFLGVATPQTEPAQTDGNAFYVGVKGEYRNFPGVSVDIEDGVLAFFFFTDGTWSERGVRITQPIDDELTEDGQNPVKGGAIYAEFEKLRAAGYLFGGVATPSSSPAQGVTEKVFYIACAAGQYPNFGTGFTLSDGMNFLLFDGTTWSVVTPVLFVNEVAENNHQLVTSGAVYVAVSNKVDKEEGKGLSSEDFTSTEKTKLGELPTVTQLAAMLALKQDVLTIDSAPVQNSGNPISSGGVYTAIQDFITKSVDNLINYYLKSDTYNKTEINNLIAAIKQFRFELVEELPEASALTQGIIYLVPTEDPKQGNVKDEFITLSRSEGGSTIYYWEQIGSTAVDLSAYSTTEQMNAAIAAALEDYYTKQQVDAAIAAAIGVCAGVSVDASVKVVNVGESASVTVLVSSSVSASAITLKKNGSVVAQGAGQTLSFTDVVNESQAGVLTYLAILNIGGTERTAEVQVQAVNPVLYGMGAVATDITTKASPRLTPVGRYNMTAAADESKIFVLVPMSMTVQYVTMSGIEVPMEAATGVIVDDVAYKCYASSNTYDAGDYVINVY